MRRQVCGLAAVIQARIRRYSRFRDSGSDRLTSRGSRKSRGLAIQFYVKQFLFLSMFHVEQSCFSVRSDTDHPISPPACHSERQRRIFALERTSRSFSRKTVFITSPSEFQKNACRRTGRSDHRRESSDYNCGRTMKRKDSSSQAPQNDKEKQNDGGGSCPKSRLFHVKHHPDRLHFVPLPMRA